MIVIRSGVFETNSSSTHTCVLCGKSVYDRWVKNEVLYCTSGRSRVVKYLESHQLEKYWIDKEFVDTAAFNQISIVDLFKGQEWMQKYITPELENYTLDDFWKAYLAARKDREDGILLSHCKSNEMFKAFQHLIGESEDEDDDPDDDIIDMELCDDFVFETLDLELFSRFTDSGYLEVDSRTATVNGQEVIALCKYGYDG